MKALPVIRSAVLQPFVAVLQQEHADVERLFTQSLLPLNAIEDESLIVPGLSLWKLLHSMETELGLHDVGYRAAELFPIHQVPGVNAQIRNSANLSELLLNFIRASHSMIGVRHYFLRRSRDQLWFCRRPYGVLPGRRSVEQFILYIMVDLVRLALGSDWHPDAIHLTRAGSVNPGELHWMGHANVSLRKDWTAIPIPLKALGRKVQVPIHDLWSAYRFDLPAGVSASLSACLQHYLQPDTVRINRFCTILGIAPRTLQRWLKDESTSYRQVLDRTRYRLAERLLVEERMPVRVIARQLGYRNADAFTRAFSRWAGCPPSRFRARHYQ